MDEVFSLLELDTAVIVARGASLTPFGNLDFVSSALAVDSLPGLRRLVALSVCHFRLDSLLQLDERVVRLFLIIFEVSKRAEVAAVVVLTGLV